MSSVSMSADVDPLFMDGSNPFHDMVIDAAGSEIDLGLDSYEAFANSLPRKEQSNPDAAHFYEPLKGADAPLYEGCEESKLSTVHMGEQDFVDADKLVLRGLQFFGYHGVKTEEKKLGQKFLVDVDAWLDLSVAGQTDGIGDTVSYTDIYRIAKEVAEGPSQNLLESVAHLIANNTLLKFPQISAIRVKVGKPHVAVPGPVEYLGIEIMRYRKREQ